MLPFLASSTLRPISRTAGIYHEKTVLITGGHSGIGLETTKQLAQSGCKLILAGRSLERLQEAAETLRSRYKAQVSTLVLDTACLDSVRQTANLARKQIENVGLDPLHALLCHAGGRFDGPVSFSTERYEITFATSYLGHSLLVGLLAKSLPQVVQNLSTTTFMASLLKRFGVTQGDLTFFGQSLAKIAIDSDFTEISGQYWQVNAGKLSKATSSKMSDNHDRGVLLREESLRQVGLTEDDKAMLQK